MDMAFMNNHTHRDTCKFSSKRQTRGLSPNPVVKNPPTLIPSSFDMAVAAILCMCEDAVSPFDICICKLNNATVETAMERQQLGHELIGEEVASLLLDETVGRDAPEDFDEFVVGCRVIFDNSTAGLAPTLPPEGRTCLYALQQGQFSPDELVTASM
jgi:hypothetical protein